MLRDQATELRNLARRAVRHPVSSLPAPRLIALAGGKGGVGVTSLGINLAVALTELGPRVVLVDANLYRADVAPLCGLSERGGVADVLAGRRDVHEVMQRGPGGVQVLPGSWAPARLPAYKEPAQQRLLEQLKGLGRHAEIVLLDIGCGPSELMQRIWRDANVVVLSTTPDDVSVMDTYATIKTLGPTAASLQILVNRAECEREVEDVFRRIAQSCDRFLSLSVELLGSVPPHPTSLAAPGSPPLQVAAPNTPAAQALAALAQRLHG